MSWLRKPTTAQRGGLKIWSIPQVDDDKPTSAFIRWLRMPWELDGRKGAARIGLTKQDGFALMRDRGRRLLVFHTFRSTIYDPSRPTLPTAEHFVIPEDAFESTP